ncbi:biorientation of chromosomes in cell division protein 1-like 1 [Dendronephthya gigantea]|uniref:biorientation of chromosomes in cell division protein 1-like 1 n=1 Tax=Dendronephthya gigantea TaxID=151771 RepID=UPI00106A889B|nr:biorientation of chromosomes in cell division protein 1-like 1 [Dendronephthya gigantea]
MAGNSSQAVEHDAKTRGIILHIVEKIKREGVFDRFRRDCLEELDSKEPYRQLKQRVESHVATFLSKQTFSANLPKNQLRTSLRANINQSEVLSKGVDRLLEQVLVEKSGSFYKEIENLVEEHLIETGHYTRYDKDKTQKSDSQPRSEFTKLSDKEVEDIIRQETDRFLEASADERSQESDRGSMAETPPPGTSGEIIEVETVISTGNNAVETSQAFTTNVVATLKPAPELISAEVSESKASVTTDKTDAMAMNISAEDDNETHPGSHKEQENVNHTSKSYYLTSTKGNAKETDGISRPLATFEAISTRASSTSESRKPTVVDASMTESKRISDKKLPGIEKSDVIKKAGENTQVRGVLIPQTKMKEKQDFKEGTLKETFNPGSKMDERKTDVMVTNDKIENTESSTLQIAQPETSHLKIDDKSSKQLTPKVGKAELTKAEFSLKDVDRQEVAKSKVAKAEIATLQVSKPKEEKEQEANEKVTKQTAEIQQKEVSKKPISMPNLFSTDEETDDDSEIPKAKISEIISGHKPDKSKVKISEIDIAELSDSDITVSSVHTSDLSSLEDSDMEYQDYQEQAMKKNKEMKSAESGEDAQFVDDKSGAAAGDDMVTRSDGCHDPDERMEFDDDKNSEVCEDDELCKNEVEKHTDEYDTESKSITNQSGAGTSEKIDGDSGAVTTIDSNEEPDINSGTCISGQIIDDEKGSGFGCR